MAANAPGNCDSVANALEFCAITLNAEVCETFDEAAESALACRLQCRINVDGKP